MTEEGNLAQSELSEIIHDFLFKARPDMAYQSGEGIFLGRTAFLCNFSPKFIFLLLLKNSSLPFKTISSFQFFVAILICGKQVSPDAICIN